MQDIEHTTGIETGPRPEPSPADPSSFTLGEGLEHVHKALAVLEETVKRLDPALERVSMPAAPPGPPEDAALKPKLVPKGSRSPVPYVAMTAELAARVERVAAEIAEKLDRLAL